MDVYTPLEVVEKTETRTQVISYEVGLSAEPGEMFAVKPAPSVSLRTTLVVSHPPAGILIQADTVHSLAVAVIPHVTVADGTVKGLAEV